MKRPFMSMNSGWQPYLKRNRENLDQGSVNAFAEMTATAREYYSGLKGHPVIAQINNNEESLDSFPLQSYHVPASQSTLSDFGFRQTYEKKVRSPDSH